METARVNMGRVEKAIRMRGMSDFPLEWGVPVGHPLSVERRDWVLSRVREYQAHKRVQDRAKVMAAVKAANFERQRYLLLTICS